MEGGLPMTNENKMLRVRLSAEEMAALHDLVGELREKGYQPMATLSSLVRQALEKWERVYREYEKGNYFTLLKTNRLDKDDLQMFLNLLSDAQGVARAEDRPHLEKMIDDFRINLMLHAGEILKYTRKEK